MLIRSKCDLLDRKGISKRRQTDRHADIQRDRKKPFGPIHSTECQVTPVCPKFQTRQADPSFSRSPSDSPFYACQMVEEHRLVWFPSCETRLRSFHPVVYKTKSFPDYFFVALSSLNLCSAQSTTKFWNCRGLPSLSSQRPGFNSRLLYMNYGG